MDLAAALAEVDRLRALAFPARPLRDGGRPALPTGVASGPGYHVADLAASADLREDDGSRLLRVLNDTEAYCQALVDLLAARWGAPETLDLAPYLDPSPDRAPVPPPLDTLCGYVPEVYGWRVDGRWIALGVGQGGRELPFRVVLAIGEADAVPAGS